MSAPSENNQPVSAQSTGVSGMADPQARSDRVVRSVSPNPAGDSDVNAGVGNESTPTKTAKRGLFGFGRKKKEDEKQKVKKGDALLAPTAAITDQKSPSFVEPAATASRAQNASPPRSNHPYLTQSSPQRNLYTSSPRISSPAGSQIFERDVQESSLAVSNSPAIPSHIQTENHIPPVLDASSEAITNKALDPDAVEIVMHSSHQPAAVTVAGIGATESGAGWAEELLGHHNRDDAASNHGALDSPEVRRLSFISFSDIVQSEQAEHTSYRDPSHVGGLSSFSSVGPRSPSPIRSPVSSQGLSTSPPTSNPESVKGLEMSPRKAHGTHVPVHQSSGSELTVETMSQALRRSGSRDLMRSQPLSPSNNESVSEQPLK